MPVHETLQISFDMMESDKQLFCALKSFPRWHDVNLRRHGFSTDLMQFQIVIKQIGLVVFESQLGGYMIQVSISALFLESDYIPTLPPICSLLT